jgi:hypothetical protein
MGMCTKDSRILQRLAVLETYFCMAVECGCDVIVSPAVGADRNTVCSLCIA